MSNPYIPDQLHHMSKKELLEFARTAHEENVKLVRQIEKETTRKECSYRVQKRLEEDNQELRQQRFRTYNDEEYIIFFDDGDDHPESMSAPVVMSADKFREMFNTRAQLAKANERFKELDCKLSNKELLHVGFTNGDQVNYAKVEEGSFYPDTSGDCYIPLYMLKSHEHRIETTSIEQLRKEQEK